MQCYKFNKVWVTSSLLLTSQRRVYYLRAPCYKCRWWVGRGQIKLPVLTALLMCVICRGRILHSHNLPCSGVAAHWNHLKALLKNVTCSCLHNIWNSWPFKLVITGRIFFQDTCQAPFFSAALSSACSFFSSAFFLFIASTFLNRFPQIYNSLF